MSRPAPVDHAPLPGLEIRVMGPLEIRVDGRPLIVDTRKALAILALLAVEGRPFGRDELAALLWPESDDASARGALRRTLSVLRAALGDRWLEVDRARVSLDRNQLWLDLRVIGDVSDGLGLSALRSAADVARGPFLAGFTLRDSAEFDDWRATSAAAAERAVGRVLDRLADVAESDGDLVTAAAAATRRIALDPLDEGSHRRLMAMLARAGDRTGAIRQYRACVSVLDRELGVPPLAETTDLYEAIRDGRAIPGPKPESAARRADLAPAVATSRAGVLPLVARDRELAVIHSAHALSIPDGRLVLVRGEAGIGKSRLVDAAADVVRARGGRVLLVRAYASERGIAYAAVGGLLRAGFAGDGALERLHRLPAATLGEIERLIPLPAGVVRHPGAAARGDDAAEPAARARLLDAIAGGLTGLAESRLPGMIVVEDLQWADAASREALGWLCRRLANRPTLVALTWRPEDLDEDGMTFVAALETVPGAEAITLGRLERDDVRALLAGSDHGALPAVDPDRLFEESEGLPLYIVEALAAGLDDPAAGAARSVSTLLRERLGSVSGTAAQVLSAAAVIGRSFDLALVRWTSGRSEEETIGALEELVRRGLVRDHASGPDTTFDFAHARFREAAYEATSFARRRLLHGRAATWLRTESSAQDPARLAQLAVHEQAAGRDAEAAEAFRGAGLRARAVYAHGEARAHLETALALGHPDVMGIQMALGEIRTIQGAYAGAIAALEAAASLSDQDGLAAIEVRLGRVHARRGELSTAASHLDIAIEALGSFGASAPDEPALLVRALVERSAVALRAGDLDRARAAGARALQVAETADDEVSAGAAYRILGLEARERGDLDAARSSLERSLTLADSDPDAATTIAARNALALVEAARGDRVAAIALLESALQACRRIGERHLEAVVENNLADQLHAVGRQEEAMDHLKMAVTAFAEIGARDELEPEIWKLVAW
jgi:DNA-binding SARP family transcriptional activator/tetratricopeptide (TPR) repeat protein/energy-coupling factor transporter ATP-binding protein EcfA2